MKLILAIVSDDDASSAITSLNKASYQVTKLATTGGFLSKGNTTLIVGCENKEVKKVLEIIGNECKKRKEFTNPVSVTEGTRFVQMPVEINVGGATVFVLDVEQFQKY